MAGVDLLEQVNPLTPVNDEDTISFEWVAPKAGAGKITFYGQVLQVNNNGTALGDRPTVQVAKAIYEDPVGIDDINKANVIKAWPNPFTGNFHITTNNLKTGNYTVQAIATNGARVYSESHYFSSDMQTIAIDANQWAKGVYVLSVKVMKKPRVFG